MSKVRILSPRPEINKNTAVDAVFLFILVELWIRTVNQNLPGSNLSLGLVRCAPNLWGIRDNLPAFKHLANLLIVAPTRIKNVALCGVFFVWGVRIRTVN